MATTTISQIIKISATYAGTVMGAGFASGQELTQFFVVYGSMGLVGLIVTGCLFAWLGNQILKLSYQIGATSYHQLLYHVCGKSIGLLLDIMITAFLFFVLTIMLAGAGTLAYDNFHLPYSLGIAIMSFSLMLTTLYGLKGITTVNIVITPLLTITILAIGIYSLAYHQVDLSMMQAPPQSTNLPAPHWLLSSLLYLSYNLVMSITVLVPLGACTERTPRMIGSIIGGLLLMLLAGLVTIVVMVHYPQSLEHQIPMLSIASSQHPFHHIAYIFIFTAAMYTTGLATLYGCATKLTISTGLSMKKSLFLLLLLGLLISQIGFSTLIAIIFPIFGYATLGFTCRILYLSFFPK